MNSKILIIAYIITKNFKNNFLKVIMIILTFKYKKMNHRYKNNYFIYKNKKNKKIRTHNFYNL
jgi:hypothetical protein